jgi:uncharacterized protein (TIGR02453 family)
VTDYPRRVTFSGFPVAALDFYDDLEMDNTKSYWTQHRNLYEDAVKAPMLELTAALAPGFAPDGRTAKVFRPYRDVRFAKDKTPYKTHQGAYVAVAPATGWYVELSAQGVRVGGGFYDASSPALAAIREAIDDVRTGAELDRLVASYEKDGWDVGGEQLKTAPRGYDRDHPRLHLLRRKQLHVGRSYGFDEMIHTPALADRVRADWQRLRPLVEWVAARTEG